MKTKPLAIALLAILVVLTVGCRTAPVRNIEDAPITTASGRYNMSDVRQAIERAATSLGWQVQRAGDGHLVGTLYNRSHTAVVDIYYNRDSYDIRYKESENLKYDGEKIHSNYNGWVQNLDRAIQQQLISL